VARHAKAVDIVQPGHIFPIMAKPGGVLIRAGHTEAGCDLSGIAGLEPAAVICEIMNDDGTMSRMPELTEFAKEHGLKIGAIRDLIEYRARTEKLVEQVSEKTVDTAHGTFRLCAFEDKTSGDVHLAMVYGSINPDVESLVRVHEPVSVLDFLDPASGRHSFPVDTALKHIAEHGNGVVVLLYRPQTGQDLLAQLAGDPAATLPALKWDPRLFGIGAQILRELKVGKMKLMASPRKIPSMAGFGLQVVGHFPAEA
jgi:3,4-dihydroxy 2-butanone 4-phosphate synthase / GTP cyclohydrolase II